MDNKVIQMKENITQHIKDEISKLSYCEDGVWYIEIGNSRLDFSKKYRLLGFTKKTVKLGWMNGRDNLIKVNGHVEQRNDYYALYTEGWSFIEHLKLEMNFRCH